MKLTIIYLAFISVVYAQDDVDAKKIKCLLNSVGKSGHVFIRNGSEHNAQKAQEHLEHKYNRAKKSSWPFHKKIEVSVNKFIDKIASKSSFSGKDYHLLVKGTRVSTREWLYSKLKTDCQSPQVP